MKMSKKIGIFLFALCIAIGVATPRPLTRAMAEEIEQEVVQEEANDEQNEEEEALNEEIQNALNEQNVEVKGEGEVKVQVSPYSDGFVEEVPTQTPDYYETKTVTSGDAETVYFFTGRNGTIYYRIYGKLNDLADTVGFYETDQYGVLLGSATLDIDLDVEYNTIAPYELEGIEVPASESPNDAGFMLNHDLTSEKGYQVYNYAGLDGVTQYRSYGKLKNAIDPDATIGWYVMTGEGNIKDATRGIIQNIHLDTLNRSLNGFNETLNAGEAPSYYADPVVREASDTTIYRRDRLYSFTGKDTNTYYRVYGKYLGEEGYYDADEYGNVVYPAAKIDMKWEEENLKPKDAKPGKELVPDMAFISSITISSVRDGTPTWDSNDNPGNDTGNDNGLVRTFDTVGYVVDANIQIRPDSDYTSFENGYAYFKLTLPVTKDIAEFDLEAMRWIVDPVVSNINGTQVLTGKRYFQADAGKTSFPGTRQFPIEVKVNAAKHGDIIKPTFELWMDGNIDPDHKYVIADDISVSAAPKYNIVLTTQNNAVDQLGHFDMATGEKVSSPNSNTIHGRLFGFGVGYQLYNDRVDKELKGIEIPTGDIDIDIKFKISKYERGRPETIVDVTDTQLPVLWDYRINNMEYRGTLGRRMKWGSNSEHSLYTLPVAFEEGSAIANRAYVRNKAGRYTASQNNNVIHLNLKGYEFDTFKFPTINGGDTPTIQDRYTKNIGIFSSAYIQLVVPFDENPTVESEYSIEYLDENFSATSIGGTQVSTQQVTSDDKRTGKVIEVLPGVYGKQNLILNENGSVFHSYWTKGDSWSWPSRNLKIQGFFGMSQGDESAWVSSFNLLQKFDDEAFVPTGDISYKFSNYIPELELPTKDNMRALFATKPDRSGWDSDNEMLYAKEDDLIYFTSMDELTSQGYTAVGVLFEFRSTSIDDMFKAYTNFGGVADVYLKDDAEVGAVYQTVNLVRVWTRDNALDPSESMLDSSITKVENHNLSPSHQVGNRYVKTHYDENGVIDYNTSHVGGIFAGESLLIVGNKATIKKTIEQKTGNSQKNLFDLDAGERIVDYKLSPTIGLANGETVTTDIRDNVRVVDVLPYGLSYIEGSTTVGGNYIPSIPSGKQGSVEGGDGGFEVQPIVEIIQDSAGRDVTQLTWMFNDVQVGKKLDDIHFSAFIGTPANTQTDVKHNDSFNNISRVFADSDGRASILANGNVSEVGFSVIKTNSTIFSKGIDRNMYEIGDNIGFELNYGNASPNSQINMRMLDILPFTNDYRGSRFNGNYSVTEVTMEYDKSFTEEIDMYYTTDASIRNSSNNAYNVSSDDYGFTLANKTVVGDKVTYLIPGNIQPTAIYFKGDLGAKTNVKISYKLNVRNNMPSNIYANDATVVSGDSDDPLYAPVVQAKVVRRTIEGFTWVDSNRNGKRDYGEEYIKGVSVSLYDENGVQVTEDLLGNSLTNVKTNANGLYRFTNLGPGKFEVRFGNGTDFNLVDYHLTETKAPGVGASVNSDAEKHFDANDDYDYAVIKGLSTPELDTMKVMDYKIQYQDAGFYTDYSTEKESSANGETKSGDIISYTITVDNPIAAQKNFVMKDPIPQGTSFVKGSIYYELANGTRVRVNDGAYSAGVITWPRLSVPVGISKFGFDVIVHKAEEDLIFLNTATTSIPGVPDTPTNETEDKLIYRNASIEKKAALVLENGDLDTFDNGTQDNPLHVKNSQEIEYQLLVKNKGTEGKLSGEIEISDYLPKDTVFVAGSMSAEFRDSSDTTIEFAGTEAISSMVEPGQDGKLVWTLNKMGSGEEALLTFRVKAPLSADDSSTEVKELTKVFENTAHLKDKDLLEQKYEASFTDDDGVTHKQGDLVYPEYATQDSNTTYHEVKDPLLTITKEVDKHGILDSGETLTYKINVTNVGKDMTDGFTIKDLIPEFTTYVTGSMNVSDDKYKVSFDEIDNGGVIDELAWNLKDLDVEETVSVTFDVTIDEFDKIGERDIFNTATVKLDEDDKWTSSNEVEHKQIIDFTIDKVSDQTEVVSEGDIIKYSMKLTSTGKSLIHNISVYDEIPEYTTYIEGSMSIDKDEHLLAVDESGSRLEWLIQNLKPNESVTVSFEVSVDGMSEEGTREIKNTASAKLPGDSDETTTNEVIHRQDIAYEVSKTSDIKEGSYVGYEDEITYTITLTNTGESTLGLVHVSDLIPEGTQFVEDSVSADKLEYLVEGTGSDVGVNWDVEGLPAGESIDLTFKVTVDALEYEGEREIVNIATSKLGESTTEKTTNEVTHKQMVEYTIAKKSDIKNGNYVSDTDTLTYSIAVKNTGKSKIAELHVSDKVPEGTTYIEGSQSIDKEDLLLEQIDTDNNLEWVLQNIEIGETVVVSFKVKVDPHESEVEKEIVNIATSSLPKEDEDKSSNLVQHKQKVDYTIAKSSDVANETFVDGKQLITYYLTIENTGSTTIKNLDVKDMIPTGTTYVENSLSIDREELLGESDDTTDVLSWKITDLPVREKVVVSFQVEVDPLDIVGDKTINNIASSNLSGQDETFEKSTNEIVHYQHMEYEVEKSSNPKPGTSVMVGDEVTYFIDVKNTGNETLRNVEIIDTIPEGTSYVKESADSTLAGTAVEFDKNTLTWEIDEILPGTSVRVSFKVSVDKESLDSGEILNTAKLKTYTKDGDPIINDVTNEVKLTVVLETTTPTVGTGIFVNGVGIAVLSATSALVLIVILRVYMKRKKEQE